MPDPAFALEGVSYRYPDAAADCARRRLAGGRRRRVRRPRRPLGVGQVDPAARRLRAGAALPRRRDRGPDRGRRARHPRPRPRRARRPRRLRRPGPRDPGRLDHGRAPRSALPLELRGDAGASRARAVEEVALALAIPHLLDRTVDTLSGGELQRVALARGARHPPAARAPRRADLPARPGRRRRADLAAAPAQRGVGGRGRALRAPPRALPRRRRPGGRDGGGARSPSTAAPQGFLAWALANDPALATPAARLFVARRGASRCRFP